MGVDGRSTVRDSLEAGADRLRGPPTTRRLPGYAAQSAGEPVQTGTQARAFAQIIHEHATEASGGLSYAQMGRFVSSDDPELPAGTSDEAAALMDGEGQPGVERGPRYVGHGDGALDRAEHVSYMAEQMALFGIVVGFALLLSGTRARHPGSRRRAAQP